MENTDYIAQEQYFKKFNWGAFMLSIYWAIGNKSYLALLTLIPIFNIVWVFICGFKGNQWAWDNNDYRDLEEFKKVQDTWNRAGFIAFIIFIIIFVLYFVFIGSIIAAIITGSQGSDYSYNYSY